MGCHAFLLTPTPDTVTIRRALFANALSALFVSATSSAGDDATLSVTVPNCLTDAPMRWRGDVRGYVLVRRITTCGNLDGQTATVTSSLGGVATATIK